MKEENNSTDTTTPPMQIPLSQGPSATSQSSAFLINDSNCYDSVLTEASREMFANKTALDPLFCYDFQHNLPMSHYQTSLTRPSDQSQFGMNSSYGFSSLPSLTNSDHGNVSVTEFSDNNSASKLNSLFMNDHVKESSSNSSNMSSVYPCQMRSMMENAGFSWDGENKLDPLFQFQDNAIKSEDFGTSSWEEGQLQTHNSMDFTSYPLTSFSEDLTEASFDVFHHI